jgi:hypothetical protein
MSWERRVRQRLDALGSAPRTELLHVLMLPDFDRGRPDRQPLGDPRPSTRAPRRWTNRAPQGRVSAGPGQLCVDISR